MPPIYRAAAAAELRVEPLDDFTLIHHRPSATTHLLASPAPEILAALQAGVSDADALLARLESEYDLPDGSAAAIAARLDELVAAGLVATA